MNSLIFFFATCWLFLTTGGNPAYFDSNNLNLVMASPTVDYPNYIDQRTTEMTDESTDSITEAAPIDYYVDQVAAARYAFSSPIQPPVVELFIACISILLILILIFGMFADIIMIWECGEKYNEHSLEEGYNDYDYDEINEDDSSEGVWTCQLPPTDEGQQIYRYGTGDEEDGVIQVIV